MRMLREKRLKYTKATPVFTCALLNPSIFSYQQVVISIVKLVFLQNTEINRFLKGIVQPKNENSGNNWCFSKTV